MLVSPLICPTPLAHLAPAWVERIQSCSARVRIVRHVSVGLCRRLLGLMAAASPVLSLGLLHMRPFLWWMKSLGIRPSWPSLLLRMDAELPDGGSDLGMLRCTRGGPLCISGVNTMPPLVLSLSPYLSGYRCASAPLAGHESVCFPSGQAVLCRVNTYGVHLLIVALFWPSQTWFSELVSLLEGDPWEIPVKKDLLCQLQGRIHETINSDRALSTRKLYSSK